jgi:hypothetical protein
MAWTAPSGHVWAVGEVLTAANLNTYSANNLSFLYGDTVWTAPTFTNSWVNFAGGFQVAGFRLIGTRVYLRGLVNSGTSNTSIFTLPAGYRPTAAEIFIIDFNLTAGELRIATTGTVVPNLTGYVSLTGINFDTI